MHGCFDDDMNNRCVMGVVSDEMELDLALSIGGSFHKSEKFGNDSSVSRVFEIESAVVDLEEKRENGAVRRLEAKKSRSRNGDCAIAIDGGEFGTEERECKKSRVEVARSEYGDMRKVNLNLSNEEQNVNCASSSPYPALQMQYSYPQLQYIPFGFPYVVPCWPSGGAVVGEERNLYQPVACRTFRRFQSNENSGSKLITDCNDSEQKSDKDGENRKMVSNRSPLCSSSVISDYRSSLQEGSRSGKTRSYSSHSIPDHLQTDDSITNDTNPQSEHCASSKQKDFTQCTSETTTNKPLTTSENSKESKKLLGKPPKPQPQTNNNAVSLSQMPCVSTTGKGPDGKTITGFLCRYTKREVSIVCVCHGKSFSPAEFVQHAGGTDVSNPLKHITVIPSAFR